MCITNKQLRDPSKAKHTISNNKAREIERKKKIKTEKNRLTFVNVVVIYLPDGALMASTRPADDRTLRADRRGICNGYPKHTSWYLRVTAEHAATTSGRLPPLHPARDLSRKTTTSHARVPHHIRRGSTCPRRVNVNIPYIIIINKYGHV